MFAYASFVILKIYYIARNLEANIVYRDSLSYVD